MIVGDIVLYFVSNVTKSSSANILAWRRFHTRCKSRGPLILTPPLFGSSNSNTGAVGSDISSMVILSHT